jgi:hypothetical protein
VGPAWVRWCHLHDREQSPATGAKAVIARRKVHGLLHASCSGEIKRLKIAA